MIENLILAHLVKDEEYSRRVIPFLKDDYFGSEVHKFLFKQIDGFVQTYKATPTFDALKLSLEQSEVSESLFKEVHACIDELMAVDRTDSSRKEWLIKETEKFCQTKALYNAISTSIGILDKDIKSAAGVPDIIKDALAVSFDSHIGHDYFEDAGARFDLLHEQQTRIPFDIDLLNTITKGGLLPKTLNILIAGCVHPETKVRIRIRPKK